MSDTVPVKSMRKDKIRLAPQAVTTRPVAGRIADFDPIVMSFDETSACAEADRCLSCPRQPCVAACPLSNDIPTAMHHIAEGRFLEAAAVYRATSPFPEICSRVCPQENLCEGACVLGKHGQPVALGMLERFVTDYQREIAPETVVPLRAPSSGKRVAVVGTGPAGMSVAHWLLELGHAVTLYEAWPAPGGWLTYAVPSYKLPRGVLHDALARLEQMGARFVFNTRIGQDIAVETLRAEYDAVFLGVGAMRDTAASFPGHNLPGVYTGTEFLLPVYTPAALRPPQMAEPEIGAHVVVFGGGDTAMDCVRTAVRLQVRQGMQPNVTLMYRRTEYEMPAAHKERHAAREEGVEFVYLAAPLAFHPGPDGRIYEVVVQEMALGEPDASGRRRPVPTGHEYTVRADVAVLALGYEADPLLGETTPDLLTHKHGLIVIDPQTGATNLPGVFAGGDDVRGPHLVSVANHDGIVAARAIHAYLTAAQP